ncbi:MAG: polysaccharide deacetylase family protein [Marinibacterium sp.]
MTQDGDIWRPLDAELARLTTDTPLPLWWRDDDADTETPALHRLLKLSDQIGLPVHLAIIPGPFDAGFAAALCADTRLIPVVHGWSHTNHAPDGTRKAEFGAHRPLPAMLDDITQGRERLAGLLGDRLAPMFVPPWNRISPHMLPHLARAGFTMISTYGPRGATEASPGLEQINTHVDPIDWRGSRSAVDPGHLIADLAAHLADRRNGRADPNEPLGILTHHLVHDPAIWSLTDQLLTRLCRAPVRIWTAREDARP